MSRDGGPGGLFTTSWKVFPLDRLSLWLAAKFVDVRSCQSPPPPKLLTRAANCSLATLGEAENDAVAFCGDYPGARPVSRLRNIVANLSCIVGIGSAA